MKSQEYAGHGRFVTCHVRVSPRINPGKPMVLTAVPYFAWPTSLSTLKAQSTRVRPKCFHRCVTVIIIRCQLSNMFRFARTLPELKHMFLNVTPRDSHFCHITLAPTRVLKWPDHDSLCLNYRKIMSC